METNNNLRWQQRFGHFNKAFAQLERFIAKKKLNEMEGQGLVKAFEYTYELAWKTLQDLLKQKGYDDVVGPRPVIEQAFQDGYIIDGKAWMQMHKSRNLTSHIYNENTAIEIMNGIKNSYFFLLSDLKTVLEKEAHKQNGSK